MLLVFFYILKFGRFDKKFDDVIYTTDLTATNALFWSKSQIYAKRGDKRKK